MFRSSHSSLFAGLLIMALSAIVLSEAVLSQTESIDGAPAAKPKKKERLIYIDFRDKPINDFMKAMTKVIKKNILVDDAVKGKITIISNKGIPESKVYPFFKSVLESKGFAVIEERDLIKIVPIKEAVAKDPKDVRIGRKRIADEDISLDRIYTQVVPINESDAQQVVSILKGIATKSTQILVFNRTNTIVISGSAPEINTLLNIIDQLDTPCDPEKNPEECGPDELAKAQNIHIYRVKHHKAEKIAQVLVKLDNPQLQQAEAAAAAQPEPVKGKGKNRRRRQPPRRPNTPQRAEKIKAVAHKETNTIIVTATKEEYREIQSIIRELDQERKQVLLEVLIAEVSADAANSFGIDWRFGPAQQNTGLAAESGVISPEGDITGVNTLLGFSIGFLEDTSGRALALANLNKSNDNFSILSSPQIMTLENEEAEINVGADIPVITGSRTSGGGTAESTIQTFEYRPIGIKLKFTPSINTDDTVGLDLFQEIKEIAGEVGSTQSNPQFTKRDVKTYVTVRNEKTIVIAGLVSTNRNKVVRKIPVLGDIPILGYLFKRESERVRKTNLLVFITPHILNNIEKQKALMEQKRREQIRFYEKNIAN